MRDILSCAFRSLRRKPLRTALTMTSITIGVMLVVVVSMIGSTGKIMLNAELENLGITGLSVSTNTSMTSTQKGISSENLEIIRNTPNVETAMPLLMEYSSSIMRNIKSNTLICGIDAGATQAISLSLKHGRLITKGDVSSGDSVCVVDETLAQLAYGRENVTGKTIYLQISGAQYPFTIVGIAKAGSSLLQTIGNYIPSMVYVPYSTLQELTGHYYFDQVAVRVKDKSTVEQTQEQLLERLYRVTGNDNYRTDNLSTQRDRLGGIMDIVSLILTAISAISVIVSGLGIMTIMLVSVNERMREIGIKKSIGASSGRILLEFLAEAVAISLLGSVVGIAAGLGLTAAGSALTGVAAPISWNTLGLLTGFCVLVGAVFGVYPAYKASRLRPVDALRHE